MAKYIMYGLSEFLFQHAESFLHLIKDTVAFCDSDRFKWCQGIMGKPVIGPKQLPKFDYDKIIITAPYAGPTIKKLLIEELRIPEADIIMIVDLLSDELKLKKQFAEYKQNEYLKLMADSGSLSPEALSNCRIAATRKTALELLPKNGIVAEMEVGYGEFTEQIFEILNPKKLYAIDSFHETTYDHDDWIRDGMPHMDWYAKRFSQQVSEGRLELWQGKPWITFMEFPDCFFDLICVDILYYEANLYESIEIAADKVKPGGHMLFTGYSRFSREQGRYGDIVPVVNKLINSGGHEVVYYGIGQTEPEFIILKI